MAMTAAVKDELSRVDVPKPCCRRSEMAALLRFAGGLHIVSGRVVVEAELDTGAVARRLRREIAEVYGYPSEIHVLASGGLRKGSHYIVRVVKDGEAPPRPPACPLRARPPAAAGPRRGGPPPPGPPGPGGSRGPPPPAPGRARGGGAGTPGGPGGRGGARGPPRR